MSNIKKFNEFFDTEDLRDQHEIEYLTGKIRDYAKTIDYNFKDTTIENFISKITFTFPFMVAFTEASTGKTGEKKFSNFKVSIKYIEDDDFYNFLVTDDTRMISLGVRLLQDNKYDVFIVVDDLREEDSKVFEESGVSYEDLCSIIANLFIPSVMEFDFDALISYKFDELITRSN